MLRSLWTMKDDYSSEEEEYEWDPSTEIPEQDWPWIWAIEERLDWKKAFAADDDAAIEATAKSHLELPVLISSVSSPNVYLSDAKHAHDVKLLKSRDITHVLNVAGRVGQHRNVEEYDKAGITTHSISAEDEEGYPMLERHWDEVQQWVASQPEGSNICVHCVAGLNRSGVLVAAHKLATEQDMNVLEVVAHLRTKRGNMVLCNLSFVAQLVAMARTKEMLGPKPGDSGCLVTEEAPPLATYFSEKAKKKNIKSLF